MPKFKKKNVKRKKPEYVKEKKTRSVFPPAQMPSKIDLQIESGEYFLSQEGKQIKKAQEKLEKQKKASKRTRGRERRPFYCAEGRFNARRGFEKEKKDKKKDKKDKKKSSKKDDDTLDAVKRIKKDASEKKKKKDKENEGDEEIRDVKNSFLFSFYCCCHLVYL